VDVKQPSKIMCVGGPWDGRVVEDVGRYLRVPKHKYDEFQFGRMESFYELIGYAKVAFKRRDGGVIHVYEAEGTDAMTELVEFYMKGKAK
jgi:hypothetical protein